MFNMRMPEGVWFTIGVVAGMAMLGAGCVLMKNNTMHCLRGKAADATAMLANQAGHKISYMGRKIAKKMR